VGKREKIDGLLLRDGQEKQSVVLVVLKKESLQALSIVDSFSALQKAVEGKNNYWISDVTPLQEGGIQKRQQRKAKRKMSYRKASGASRKRPPDQDAFYLNRRAFMANVIDTAIGNSAGIIPPLLIPCRFLSLCRLSAIEPRISPPFAQHRRQFILLHRFWQIIIHPRLNAQIPFTLHGVGGHRYDRHLVV